MPGKEIEDLQQINPLQDSYIAVVHNNETYRMQTSILQKHASKNFVFLQKQEEFALTNFELKNTWENDVISLTKTINNQTVSIFGENTPDVVWGYFTMISERGTLAIRVYLDKDYQNATYERHWAGRGAPHEDITGFYPIVYNNGSPCIVYSKIRDHLAQSDGGAKGNTSANRLSKFTVQGYM